MFKTWLAIVIVVTIMRYGFKTTPFFGCIGALVSMGNSYETSIKAFIDRNSGTLIGGAIGIVLASITSNEYLLSLGVMLVILVLKKFKLYDAIVPGLIVFCAVVYLNDNSEAINYGIRRISQTLVGSIVGLIINFTIKSPKTIKS
ncbi:MAG: FUSC family protein [Bacilli bacterium]